MMSPFMFVVTITSNCSGFLTSWWQQLSMMTCQLSMSGYSLATASKVRLSMPSVIFMMFDLVAQATDLRPSDRANSNASRTIFSQPLRADQLQALGDARRLHVLDAGVEVFDVLADDDQVDAAAAVGRGHAGQFADRADVAVGLEQLAQRDVGRLLAVADRACRAAL